MIEKAKRSLSVARDHIDSGNFDFASGRAYYAVFYCMEAALLTKGKSYSKHTGVISGFGEYFIGRDVFPKDFAKYIARLFRNRQIWDYEFGVSISETDAREDVEYAGVIAQHVFDYLREHGFLSLPRAYSKRLLRHVKTCKHAMEGEAAPSRKQEMGMN